MAHAELRRRGDEGSWLTQSTRDVERTTEDDEEFLTRSHGDTETRTVSVILRSKATKNPSAGMNGGWDDEVKGDGFFA